MSWQGIIARWRSLAARLRALAGRLGRGRTGREWDAASSRVLASARRLERRVDADRRRATELSRRLVGATEGHRVTLLRAAPPGVLLAVVHDLLRLSFAARFSSPRRSLHLAKLARQVAQQVTRSGLLAVEPGADLDAEVLIYLGNAQRLVGDLNGAAEALSRAESLLGGGTGDLSLRATLISMRTDLYFARGEPERAIESQDEEIRLRRRLGDPGRLSHALLGRTLFSAWTEPLAKTCTFMEEAIRLADTPRTVLLCLGTLAERFARDGRAGESFEVLEAARLADDGADGDAHRWTLLWVEGLAWRAAGHDERAARCLEAVRASFLEGGRTFRAAVVTLDLTPIYARLGRPDEVRRLVEEAYSYFVSQRLDRQARACLLVMYGAAREERLSADLALEITDFLVCRRYDRGLPAPAALCA